MKKLTLEEVGDQIRSKTTIADKLDYWNEIKNKFIDEPLNKSYGKYFSWEEEAAKKVEMFGKDYATVSPLKIPENIYAEHFENGLFNPDFTNWFLKYNAYVYFEQLLIHKKLSNKIQSAIADKFIEAELREINEFEEKAGNLLLSSNLDIYQYNDPTHQNSEEIEYLRIKADYYTENALPDVHGGNTVALYATHIFLKDYLQRELKNQSGIKGIVPVAEQPEKDLKLEKVFSSVSRYKKIMEILVKNDLIQEHTYLWKDEGKANKQLLVSLLKYLHSQGYYKGNKRLTNGEIQKIASNTFGWSVSEDTVKKTKASNFPYKFIPPSSTLD